MRKEEKELKDVFQELETRFRGSIDADVDKINELEAESLERIRKLEEANSELIQALKGSLSVRIKALEVEVIHLKN